MIKITVNYNKGFSLTPDEVRPVDEYYVKTIEEAKEIMGYLMKETTDIPAWSVDFEEVDSIPE